jgi:hypothetical protein
VKLVASSVVRGTHPNASSGGLYLIDLETRTVHQPVGWNERQFKWDGRGRELGLRGIAFDGDTMYCVASDELYAFNSAFELKASWRNPYLKYCRGIAVFERKLFIVSSGFDSIIGFDMDAQTFDWALQVTSRGIGIGASPFDPNSEDGPIMLAKLDMRDIFCDGTGMYITSGPGMLRFSGNAISMAVELPPNSHNARPFRDGVLFNDSLGGTLRYTGRGEGEEDRAMPTASLPRGLCVIGGAVVAGGSSPAAISVYDLAANERVLAVQISDDAQTSIHSIAVWPFD